MSSLSTLPKGDSAWLLRKSIQRIMQQVSVLETNIGSSTTGNSSNTQVIFNDNGTLRGDAGLTYNAATDTLSAGSATITGDLTVSTAARFNGGALAGYLNGSLMFGSSGNIVNFFAQLNGFAFKENTGANNLLTISNAGVFGFLDGAGGTRMTLNSTGLGVGTSPTGYGILALKKDNTSAPPYIVLDNRGTGGTDTNTYTQGGILFGAFRDVSNPAYIASITVERKSAAGGASSTGDLIFGTASTPTNGVATERLRIDSSGNVGIGVTPSAWGGNFKPIQIGSGTVSSAFVGQTNSPVARIMTNSYFDGTNFVKVQNNTAGMYVLQNNAHEWYNATTGTGTFSFTQAMTLNASGNLLVARTGAGLDNTSGVTIGQSSIGMQTEGNATQIVVNRTTSDGIIIDIRRNNVSVGNIAVTTLATTYNSISDYRLKESVKPISGGLARVSALKPSIYNWKANGSAGEGFLAHELAQVVPAAVTGEKDAVNEDGSINAQSIDMSRIVPILVAAIQELTAEVNALKNA